MTGWTALVPLKMGAMSKSRLATLLSAEEREALGVRMARHVIGCLSGAPGIDRVVLLSPRPIEAMEAVWCADRGRGINAELVGFVDAGTAGPLLVMLADLPLLTPEDVAALLDEAGRHGAAIAPDRHGIGTNALALRSPAGFSFAFGTGSFRHHRDQLAQAAIVERTGLSHDLDTPEDLHFLTAP